jgi:Ion channel
MAYIQRFVRAHLHGWYRYWQRVRLSPVFPFLVIVLLQVYLWQGFLTQTHRNPASPLLVTTDTAAIIAGVAILVFAARPEGPIAYLFLAFLNAASLLLVDFSFLYWSHGTTVNFSQRLSHLDAVYFTVGTLATAGTGNISATSEWSRGVQTAQMFVNMTFVLFGLGFLVSRLGTEHRPPEP